METYLEPCPFCGSVAAWGEGEQKEKYGNEQAYCPNCYAMSAPEMAKAEAAKRWNHRAPQLASAGGRAVPPGPGESITHFMQRLANLCPRHARAQLPRPTVAECVDCGKERNQQ